MEGLRSESSTLVQPPTSPSRLPQKTDSSHGRVRIAQPPGLSAGSRPCGKKEATEEACTCVHRLSSSTRAVSGKELFNHFVRSFAWQIRLRLFPLPLPSLTYICTHVRVCAARESVVGDDGEQSVDRPSVRGRPTGCTDETTHADAVVFPQPLPSSCSSVIDVVDAAWLRRSC